MQRFLVLNKTRIVTAVLCQANIDLTAQSMTDLTLYTGGTQFE